MPSTLCPNSTRILFYHLESLAKISPHQIENVQRSAARYLFNDYTYVYTRSELNKAMKYTIYVHCRKIYNLFVRALETGRKASIPETYSFGVNWLWSTHNITTKVNNSLRFTKRNIKTSNKQVKENAFNTMSELNSNTVLPSGIPV
jgi:outer membrane protease